VKIELKTDHNTLRECWLAIIDGEVVGKIFRTPASRWNYEAFTLPPDVKSVRINTLDEAIKFFKTQKGE